MTYGQQRVLAIAVAVMLGMIGVVALADPDVSGLTVRQVFWLTVVSTGLGILQSFLPSVRGADQQPEHIANRILELSPAERSEVTDLVEAKRAARELRMGPRPPEEPR